MANSKKYYWLKLKNDFFTSKEMKKLRKIAGGDTYTIIYLKLQLLSLQNEGMLYFDGIDETFVDELALTIDEEPDNVNVTLNFLQKCNLAEIKKDDSIFLKEVPLCTGKECESAERVRRFRKNEQLKALQCNSDVTKCKTEIGKEIEKEIEIDKENKKINYQQISDMYNDICISFPKCKTLSDARKKAIKARLKTYSVDDFKNLFEIAEMSDFLKGNNDRNWNATFDWLIKDSNMAKVLDGNYNNKNKGGEINDIRRKDKKVVERELDENEREINRIFGIE